MKSTNGGFQEELRARLQAEIETERWSILASQKKLIEQYALVTEQLRQSELKISRLVGPPPDEDICPQCHYRCGSKVNLLPAGDVNRAGDGMMICPTCSLILSPSALGDDALQRSSSLEP